ncbi:MAG: hypothetical protein R2932_58160 [Caldilineaceae bacterium]
MVGGASQGERYPITGQAFDCQWFRIEHPVLGAVWFAGGNFAAADGDCSAIPTIESDTSAVESDTPVVDTATPTAAPATDTAAATATPASSVLQPTATPASAAEAATATPAPATEPAVADDSFPADKGCLLLQINWDQS